MTFKCKSSGSEMNLDSLKKSNLPVWIYGGGQTAIRVYERLLELNIKVEGFFVDDQYYKQETMLFDKPLLSKSFALKKEKMNIVIGYSDMVKAYEFIREGKNVRGGYTLGMK